ncbi:MAG: acetyl-CoA carboxylase biotin carboxyl carrier protein [Victivallaceae bacterium]|nr:acetyl-CoA carboxylase biotin carboxyl carrier protein [Victivallaceae bacterium]
MNIEEIKTIVKLMSEHDLTEFKVEAGEYNLCIRRGSSNMTPMLVAAPQQAIAQAPAAASAPAAPAPAPAEPKESIDSPLVGTFYRSGSPDAAPFIQVGDKVTPDTVVAIIEAMKVMNEIKAEKSGVIKEVLAENGQAVEFGQPLFIIG